MLITRRFALALSPLAIAFAVPAAAQDTERMVEIASAEAESGAFMGAVIVANDDTVLLERAWGSANLEWDIANTPDTKFRIGSVTKQFTSVAIMKLAEQGLIDLDAPISTYLEGTPESWSAITVRNLMRHTAGLPNVTSLDGFGDLSRLETSQDDLIAFFRDLPLEFEPGSKWSYSNSGYVLLSRIVEQVSEQDIATYFDEQFFTPLGMENSGFDVSAEILPKRAAGYSPGGEGRVNAGYVFMGIPTGAGAMYSTVSDLHRWNKALYSGEILSPESVAEFVEPAPHDAIGEAKYAHGVVVSDSENGQYIWHGGGIQGFNAWLGYDRAKSTTVAVLANLNGGSAENIGRQLMTLAQGGEIPTTADRVAVEVPAEALAEYEGVYALAPTFKITTFVEGGKLMAQATGQGANEIFREEGDTFFLKVVDAQVRFNRDDSGTITGLTLFQGGREMPATKE
ncbi:beta-lactamase family protein [Erythrobacter sp. NAP1]|uniref:serine hydrolase n=1 Tax=Erythrobacter sp. NAP1 TaxID=237727 RepID=UPI0000686958|nr:serine hydrolase [Erythrobacter sp. NAP1]EAQ30558.1 beta-lactamase family protein [Erythrobacter sp. NAP1]